MGSKLPDYTEQKDLPPNKQCDDYDSVEPNFFKSSSIEANAPKMPYRGLLTSMAKLNSASNANATELTYAPKMPIRRLIKLN